MKIHMKSLYLRESLLLRKKKSEISNKFNTSLHSYIKLKGNDFFSFFLVIIIVKKHATTLGQHERICLRDTPKEISTDKFPSN